MPTRFLPLFPLHVVVFPRTPLPLHIFEERYKELAGVSMRDDAEFGIVLAQDEGIVNTGCSVKVEKLIQMYPDGRMDILTRGQRRFEIQTLNEEKVYLQAEVSFFDDEEGTTATAELRDEAVAHYQEWARLPASAAHAEPDLADPQLSFQLAHAVADLEFLNGLLRHRSETARLQELNRYLAQYVPRQRGIERIKGLAPTNGFGGKPAGL